MVSFRTVKVYSFCFLLLINFAAGFFFYSQLGELMRHIRSPVEVERPFLSDILQIQNLTSSLDLQLHHQIAGNLVDNISALGAIENVLRKVELLEQNHELNPDGEVFVHSYKESIGKLRLALIYYQQNQKIDPSSSATDQLYSVINDELTNINLHLFQIISVLRYQIDVSDQESLEKIVFSKKSLLVIYTFVGVANLLVFLVLNIALASNLGRLAFGVNKIGAGDLSWRIDSSFGDEFGSLSDAFDEMAQKIDVSNQKILHQTQKIEKLAYYDLLTELPNRFTFLAKLQSEVARASRHNETFAVLFVDLDDFKVVNDVYGHEIGDKLLKEVAERMIDHTRETDTVSRIGSDEFIILLPQHCCADPESSEFSEQDDLDRDMNRSFYVSNRIVNGLNQPFNIQGNEILISSSIGISLFPENGSSAEEIMRNADTAMYVAKAEGKNTFKFCSKEMAARMQFLFEMEKELRKAINGNQFSVLYQPQVDVESGEVRGFEALIRWFHPEKGFISPVDFIPLAEERGMINEITHWVLQTVCKQLQVWTECGLPALPVMVNLSARDFYYNNIDHFINELVQEHNIDPHLLGVEVTETAVMEDKTNAFKNLLRIKDLGVKISLDDFGTGYSSLNYLQSLPIDIVKIDKSFVRNITTNTKSAKITEAIITMSHALDLKVLVEGIEYKDQLDFIEEINCDYYQGFLFSKPIPVEEVTALLQKM